MRLGLSILLGALHFKRKRAARFGEFSAKRFVISRRASDWHQVGERRIEIHKRQQQRVCGYRIRASVSMRTLGQRCTCNVVKNGWWHLLALRKRAYIGSN